MKHTKISETTDLEFRAEFFNLPDRVNFGLPGNAVGTPTFGVIAGAEGDYLAAKLRPGNVHSADDWEKVLVPEIEHQQKLGKEVVFRADAAFAKSEVYEALEARDVKYAVRIPANDSLEGDIAELLPRPVGRPSQKPLLEYKGFLYQAASWKTARRVVAKVEHHAGELFPRVGFIVTNLTLPSRAVVRFYNKRGTAEQWIKEAKQGSSRQGCESGGVRVPVPSIACFGRLAYPGHAEATKHDVLGRKSHKPLCRKLQWWERLGWQAN
jgi:hypothetical protein